MFPPSGLTGARHFGEALRPVRKSHMKIAQSMIAAMMIAGVTLASPGLHAEDISNDWQFSATVYGWFPDIGGHTRFASGGGTIDVDIGTILDHLKMTAQGSFEVHKGHWGAFTDLVYLDVGEAGTQTRNLEINGQPLPASVTAAIDFDLKSVFWTLAGSYRVAAGDRATLDVLLGARLASFKPSIEWQFSGNFGPVTPPPLTGSRQESVEQWDAIVGVRGRVAFGADNRWSVPYHFDAGTGDSDLTWQAMAGIACEFGWGDLAIAWRYLDYDAGPDGPIADMNFSGPAIGANFRW
jgi:hypothetical protein